MMLLPSLGLPKEYGSFVGNVTLHLDDGDGLVLDSLKLAVSNLNIGKLQVKNFEIDYTGKSQTWNGTADVVLPPLAEGRHALLDLYAAAGNTHVVMCSKAGPRESIRR